MLPVSSWKWFNVFQGVGFMQGSIWREHAGVLSQNAIMRFMGQFVLAIDFCQSRRRTDHIVLKRR